MRNVSTTFLMMLMIAGELLADPPMTFSLGEDPSEPRSATEAHPQTSPDVLPSRRTQWLMFTAGWCQPCQAAKHDFEPWMRRSGWIVDETHSAHVRLIDADRQPNLVQQFQIAKYPTFLLVQVDRVLHRQEGYPGRQELVRRYQQAMAAAPTVVGTISVGALKGQREKIAQVIATMRTVLGDGGTFSLQLERPGLSEWELPLGDRLTIHAANPTLMNCTMKDDVLRCRFEKPYPRGRWTFGVPWQQAISAVTLSATEVVIELPDAPDLRLKVEP